MKRFFGMMPSDEIELSKTYDDGDGLKITIDAGPHGWTILYADGGTNYKDCDQSAEDNFNEAYKIAKENFPELKEISNSCQHRQACSACEAQYMDN